MNTALNLTFKNPDLSKDYNLLFNKYGNVCRKLSESLHSGYLNLKKSCNTDSIYRIILNSNKVHEELSTECTNGQLRVIINQSYEYQDIFDDKNQFDQAVILEKFCIFIKRGNKDMKLLATHYKAFLLSLIEDFTYGEVSSTMSSFKLVAGKYDVNGKPVLVIFELKRK